MFYSLLQGTPRTSGATRKSGECVALYCLFKAKWTVQLWFHKNWDTVLNIKNKTRMKSMKSVFNWIKYKNKTFNIQTDELYCKATKSRPGIWCQANKQTKHVCPQSVNSYCLCLTQFQWLLNSIVSWHWHLTLRHLSPERVPEKTSSNLCLSHSGSSVIQKCIKQTSLRLWHDEHQMDAFNSWWIIQPWGKYTCYVLQTL